MTMSLPRLFNLWVFLQTTTHAQLVGMLPWFDSLFSEAMTTISLSDLQEQFPNVPLETQKRFFDAHGSESIDRLEEYLTWKERHPTDFGIVKDFLLWAATSKSGYNTTAFSWYNDLLWQSVSNASLPYVMPLSGQATAKARSSATFNDEEMTLPPTMIYWWPHRRDQQNRTILQVLSKRMDLDLYSNELYVDACATYLEAVLAGEQQCTLMIDLRPGRGWPNPFYIRCVVFAVVVPCLSLLYLHLCLHCTYLSSVPTNVTHFASPNQSSVCSKQ